MRSKINSIVLIIVICVIAAVFIFGSLLTPDAAFSRAERRRLSSFPKFNVEDFFSGEYFSDIEDYLLDQFWQRDAFRSIKAFISYNIFNKTDNNGLVAYKGHLFKVEHSTNISNITRFAKKNISIIDNYLTNSNILWVTIPDKINYVSDALPTTDYDLLNDTVKNMLKDRAAYIDLRNVMSLDDFYYTDLHWRQEKIVNIANLILGAFGRSAQDNYTEIFLPGFEGTYYGQYALPFDKDTMIYLTNDILPQCVCRDGVTGEIIKMYNEDELSSLDGYNLYLKGPMPLITIENSQGTGELIIFRDSFGSSLAPLLASSYAKITIIDLRYISTTVLDRYVSFDGADVLFIYGSQSINSIDLG